MAEEFIKVEMTEDKDIRVRKKDFELTKGDVIAVPRSYAGKIVNRWKLGEFRGDEYEVGEQDIQDEIRVVEGSGTVEEDESGDELEEMTYNELKSFAAKLEIDTSGTKDELVSRIRDEQ